MKSPKIPVLIDHADYDVFAAAARLARKARGKDAPDTDTLIEFQFKHRSPEGLAKDYLDCTGDYAARRRIKIRIRRAAPASTRAKCVGRMSPLKSVRVPGDPSRN